MDKYSEALTTLELPTDYSRPLERRDQGGVHSLRLTNSQSAELRALARSEGVTMYTLFLAVYKVLLSKLSNQDDIVVGTPTAGRHHSDLEGLVGMFVNTLALRTRVDREKTFRDFLASVQEDTLLAFDHQLYQYEELVEALDLSRDTGRNPLFDVFFSYSQQFEDSGFNDDDLTIVGHDIPHTVAKFDLSLAVLDSETINLFFTYRKDLFKASSIERFSGYLDQVIAEILKDAAQVLGDIEILSLQERERLLIEFNDTAQDYDLEQTVLDMFISQSRLAPEATALVFGEERLTYRDLDVRSDLWASCLVDSGVVSGAIVGLMMTRSTEMMTAILAIMKAGAAYLPINTDQPISRTHHMLEDCGVSTVLTNLNKLPKGIEKGYSCLRADVLDLYGNVINEELPGVSSDSLAYVIYTSGSTGQPKGVLIQHEGVSNLNCFQRELFQIDATDKVLQFSPYYFDASVEQIWLALAAGGTLVLIHKDYILDSNVFKEYLFKNAVTYVHATPSFLENLPIEDLPSIRIIISGGEACKPSLANRFIGQSRFINEYGPTEGTVVSIAYEVDVTIDENKNVPIGKPIANTQAYILDDRLCLLAQGVIGELYLGGKGLSSGYLNRPDLTRDRFIANPFGEGLIYRTGDLVRWLSDGTMEYLGRNDDQVKIRGIRIELGEIASRLEDIDSVRQALVTVHESGDNKQLIAYLCGDGEQGAHAIKSLLSSELPDYMVPTELCLVGSLST